MNIPLHVQYTSNHVHTHTHCHTRKHIHIFKQHTRQITLLTPVLARAHVWANVPVSRMGACVITVQTQLV